jgi:hypothetical protein
MSSNGKTDEYSSSRLLATGFVAMGKRLLSGLEGSRRFRVGRIQLTGLVAVVTAIASVGGISAQAQHMQAPAILDVPAYVYVDTIRNSALEAHIGISPASGGSLTFALATKPSHGTVELSNPGKNSWVYTPEKTSSGMTSSL